MLHIKILNNQFERTDIGNIGYAQKTYARLTYVLNSAIKFGKLLNHTIKPDALQFGEKNKLSDNCVMCRWLT